MFDKFFGESFDINYYYQKNNILLVPNEIDIGIRVRIITGLSFGAIIVTHSSNLKGIPELKITLIASFFQMKMN